MADCTPPMKTATTAEAEGASRPMDPLFTLHVGPGHGAVGNVLFGSDEKSGGQKVGSSLAVSGVCFIRDADSMELDDDAHSGSYDSDSDSESSDDDDEPLQFRCSQILLGKDSEIAAASAGRPGSTTCIRHDPAATSAAASISLRGGLMASSHANGNALIWDLGTRRIVSHFADGGSRGPGLALQRMGDTCGADRNGCYRFLYHSRGTEGIVSIHDTQANGRVDTVVKYTTRSRTFCAASACAGGGSEGRNLIALPSSEDCTAVVVDVRIDPTAQPAFAIHGAALAGTASGGSDEWRKHGMLTSLALCGTSTSALDNDESVMTSSSGPILGCGMESGSIFFYDLAMPGKAVMENQPEFKGLIAQRNRPTWSENGDSTYLDPPHCSVSIGKDPVLSLDFAPSSVGEGSSRGAIVAVGGCAGDADDLAALPEEEQKTVAVIKTTRAENINNSALHARIRSRVQTCQIGEHTARGKPGVGICRFRPDGRMFAVGGWDKRLRVFGRAAGTTPLALMRSHIDSVTAIDWAPDSASWGILATGSEDGQISLWRAFPHTDKKK